MRISVDVKPRASRDKVERISNSEFKIWTTAPPTDNQANEAVRELLADHLGVAKSRVVLYRGATARKKVFDVI